jgi:hypothetical protein
MMNRSITERKTQENVAHAVDAGSEAISERLCALDNEWSSGRAGKATAGVMIAAGLGLGGRSTIGRVFGAVGGGLLAHALLTRRGILDYLFEELGFRSHTEIEQERIALRALRGDFRQLPTIQDVESQDDIARLEGEGGNVLEPEEAKADPKEAAQAVLDAART